MTAMSSPSSKPIAPSVPALQSPSRRAWNRFKANRLGLVSLALFCILVVISLLADVLSTDKPLLVKYQGQLYFPLVVDYPEKTFGGDFDTSTDYLDPYIQERLSTSPNWVIMAPNPYGPKTLN